MYCSECGEKIKTYAYTFIGEVGIITILTEDEDGAWETLRSNVVRADEYQLEDVEEITE